MRTVINNKLLMLECVSHTTYVTSEHVTVLALETGVANSHGVVPASRGHLAALARAAVAHALAACPAVVNLQLRTELLTAHNALVYVFVGSPVGRS